MAILGERQSGKTTFLASIALAARDYTLETGKGEFVRWQSSKHALMATRLTNSLEAQVFPEATLKNELQDYWFLWGFQKRLGKLEKRVPFAQRIGNPARFYHRIAFFIYDMAGENFQEFYGTIAAQGQMGQQALRLKEVLAEPFQRLLECNVLIFVIDASKVNSAEPGTEAFKELRRFDAQMGVIISATSEYRAQTRGESSTERKLYPIFVFTKWDLVHPDIIARLNSIKGLKGPTSQIATRLNELLKGKKQIIERKTPAAMLMAEYFPNALSYAIGSKLVGVSFDLAQLVTSYVRDELNDEGKSIPSFRFDAKRKTKVLDYSYDTFKDFITFFKKNAGNLSDREETIQRLGNYTNIG